MQIKIESPLVFPVEQIVTSIDVENMDFYSQYMALKLAEKNYRELGYSVLHGADFENNFILYLNKEKERRYLDDYFKVKIGRSHLTADIAGYCETMLGSMTRELTEKLLYFCRLCSYTGGPGFPDVVLLKDSYDLKYVLFDELQSNQKLFLMLCKLAGINIGLIEVSAKIEDKSLTLVPSVLLNDIVSDSRNISVYESNEEAIQHEKKKLSLALSTTELAQVEDEIEWIANENRLNPFHMFKKWLSSGMISTDDIIENMNLVHRIQEKVNEEFGKYEKELLADEDYMTIISRKHEEFMRKKADIMQKKFAIGPAKAKALLRFMEAR